MLVELQKIFPDRLIVQKRWSFAFLQHCKLYDYLTNLKNNAFIQAHRYLAPRAELDVCRGPVDVFCTAPGVPEDQACALPDFRRSIVIRATME